MTGFLKRAGLLVFAVISGLLVLVGILYICGFRINSSGSIPIGLYWLTKRPLQKSEYVLLCPPDEPLFKEALKRGYLSKGFCALGSSPLMKRVLATSGDSVLINQHGVWVNNHFIAHSRPFQKDDKGRLLPQLNQQYLLNDSQVLLMTDQSEFSFDARYFGLLNRLTIQAVIKPVLVWKSTFIK
ncbi:MAG: conjugative transfer signal peptidase TraF [Tatlockia sp.]|nr:conjugative transfer signal peptidase TraF [Tatlockia sp.]